ncbi:tyrosine-type recombinase/integrase [Parasedimentitalea psychrophila]|uniref:Tyrosine-type recombinase/integrase n=1 Tax=Parasedimentitalea psychrophila TaxID=2997337 RepID=A0A9Y2P1Q8_9RHOB|nr:site-specific integrase [Parasedimentitalea psychrophila]WIY24332.1 tyrosine-type recombinase/integrase [Parasedimentitalea psychrophila]
MPQKSFTAHWVETIAAAGARADYFDQKLPGLGLRVSPTGAKAWFYMYRPKGNPKKTRLTIGRYPALSLADAREIVLEKALMVSRGQNPANEQRALKFASVFCDLAAEYVEKYAKEHKRSWREDERVIKHDLLPVWAHTKAQDITRRDVIALLDRIVARGSGIQANRTLALIRKIFNWGFSRDLVAHNPCHQVVAPAKERQRDRVLKEGEMRALWAAFEQQGTLVCAMFKLRLVTAQRGGEVCSMAWSDVDFEDGWWTIPAQRAKNGLTHRVPLSGLALSILRPLYDHRSESGWVFPSPVKSAGYMANTQKAAQRIREIAGIVDFVPHDLRRTAASYMTSLQVSRLVVSKILNHVEPGITRVYDRYSYDQEKREALETWAERLADLLNGSRLQQGGGDD